MSTLSWKLLASKTRMSTLSCKLLGSGSEMSTLLWKSIEVPFKQTWIREVQEQPIQKLEKYSLEKMKI